MKFELKMPTINLDFLDRISPFQPKFPLFAAELNRKNLIMVSMRKEKDRWFLSGYAIKDIPENAVGASIFHPEIGSKDALVSAIRESAFKIGFKSTSISVLIPDNIVRVSLLAFQELPSSKKQLTEMIMWKMKRSIPYKIEDTMVSYQVFGSGNGAREKLVLISLIPKSILRMYEDIFTDMDVRVGLVDVATFGIYNLFRKNMEHSGDIGLINCSSNYFTFMIIRNGNPLFFRCKNYQPHEGALEEETRKVLKRELNTSLSYYVEKLSGLELQKTYVRSIGYDTGKFMDLMKEAGIARCEIFNPSSLIDFGGFSGCDADAQQKLIPAIGAVVGRIE